MPARLSAVLPALARNRDTLNFVYAQLIAAGKQAPIPCAALDAYRVARAKTLKIEGAIVQAAKVGIAVRDTEGKMTKQKLHPPEDVPRSFPLFAACSPGAEEAQLAKDAVKAGEAYVKATQNRSAAYDKALMALYSENEEVRGAFDRYLLGLSSLARPGTVEEMPAPQNISLLRLLFYLGGTLWPLVEADKLQAATTEVITEEDVGRVYGETVQLARAAQDFAASVGAASEPIMSKKGWALILGGAVAVAGAAATGAWYFSREPPPQRYTGDDENVIDSTAEETPFSALPAHGG